MRLSKRLIKWYLIFWICISVFMRNYWLYQSFRVSRLKERNSQVDSKRPLLRLGYHRMVVQYRLVHIIFILSPLKFQVFNLIYFHRPLHRIIWGRTSQKCSILPLKAETSKKANSTYGRPLGVYLLDLLGLWS